jgi:hypothetical protein
MNIFTVKTKILIFLVQISVSLSWVHDGKTIGIGLIKNSVNLPVNYFYVQLINIYGQK